MCACVCFCLNDNLFYFISWNIFKNASLHIHSPACVYCCRNIHYFSFFSLSLWTNVGYFSIYFFLHLFYVKEKTFEKCICFFFLKEESFAWIQGMKTKLKQIWTRSMCQIQITQTIWYLKLKNLARSLDCWTENLAQILTPTNLNRDLDRSKGNYPKLLNSYFIWHQWKPTCVRMKWVIQTDEWIKNTKMFKRKKEQNQSNQWFKFTIFQSIG